MPYIIPPLVVFILIWVSTLAFNLLSAPSDIQVILGIVILIGLIAIVYRFIVSIINNVCR